jgi:membrane protein YdbS with pleckstrin-like domain
MSDAQPHPAEETLWSGSRSGWHYFGRWLLGLIVAAGLCAGLYFFGDQIEPWTKWAYAAPVAVLLLVMFSVSISRRRARYRVTSRRVIMEIGFVVKDSNEVRIQDIRSINVLKRGLGGLFGIGNVEFSSAAADDADVVFVGIGGADNVRDLVRKLQS